MYAGFYEEGDRCPSSCGGRLSFQTPENCSCHISPPCHSCTSVVLECKECGWTDEPPEEKYIRVAPGLSMRETRPKPLDKTKISYRSKMHSSSSMIKEGVYPEGTTLAEVKKIVDGTFGGKFEHFGNGKFKFIAYTD